MADAAEAAVRSQLKRSCMTDFGLDLAVIGNGRTAAQVAPSFAEAVLTGLYER
jgi:cation diffusion facilitator CzcD-associated flavoprotein CzcO